MYLLYYAAIGTVKRKIRENMNVAMSLLYYIAIVKLSCGVYKATQTNASSTVRCYCYRLFPKVDDDLRRGVRVAQLHVALFRSRCCLAVAFFFRFRSPQPPFLFFGQWALIAGRGWLVARGQLMFVHGDGKFYWRPLFLIVGQVEADFLFACVVDSTFVCHFSVYGLVEV